MADHHPELVAQLSEQFLAWQKELPAGPTDPGVGRVHYRWPAQETAAEKK